MTDGAGNSAPEVVSRLAVQRGGETPFLLPHHVEAARRLAKIFERARIMQRVTMSYDPARLGGRSGGGGAQADLSVSAADARRQLADLGRQMPAECWSVLFDVCGLDLGLQEIEIEHDWPRRSSKLVLRIALSQLAAHYGLDAEGHGRLQGPQRGWLPERLAMFKDDAGS
ncbi:DUF6456 domain-containing protein [Devosia soli]|uniref:DUF6456 domain-containing protein n=1 Tax=Devosia soli TaxID=361041 RepID=UPI0006992B82|nr:DUF6456 domain-containing protein [Devosia soli]